MWPSVTNATHDKTYTTISTVINEMISMHPRGVPKSF